MTLREIEMEFDAADIPCSTDFDPGVSGQRRTLVQQYYRSINFADWSDVRKVLKVFEALLHNLVGPFSSNGAERVESLCKWLAKDGFIYENGILLSAVGTHGLPELKGIAAELNAEVIGRQIQRMQDSVDSDPALAIGSAKELVETCCKTVLNERGITIVGTPDLLKLAKAALKELRLVPEGIPDTAKGAEIIKRTLNNLANIVHGLAELRGLYGTGHGTDGRAIGVLPRHAKLAVGAAATFVTFLFETLRETSK